MPAYVIALVRAVDPDGADALAEYRRRNTDAVARHGGRFAVRGGPVVPLELVPEGEAPLRVVVLEFADAGAARGWYESEEYAPLRELRRGASATDILLVEGVAG